MSPPRRDRTLVRASDIGMWSYCQRAWWLATVQGATHQDPARRQHGTARHRSHGMRTLWAIWARQAGLILIGIGGLLLLLALLWVALS
jgi:hypothetical protein